MGNKSDGRKINNLDNISYQSVMGASVSNNIQNTGINFTNLEVFKYFRILRNYFLNRFRWTSNKISKEELRLIEYNIFYFGKCAMLKPKITKNRIKLQTDSLKIYRCNYTKINNRNFKPKTISIVDTDCNAMIDINYTDDEFTIFSDDYLYYDNLSFSAIAWEHACKLHEIDLAFNANSHRNRLPFVFNNANFNKDDTGSIRNLGSNSISIAEIMRSALGRNEQFVEISENMVGENGFLHEPQHVQNNLLEFIETQKRVYESYFQLLGLYTNKERVGVYTAKNLLGNEDQTGDYIVNSMLNNRLICAENASRMFDIDLTIEVV